MKSIGHLFEINIIKNQTHKTIDAKAKEIGANAKEKEASVKLVDIDRKKKKDLINQMSTGKYTNPS